MATMDLHRDLCDAEFGRDLLVHETIGDVCHHLPLARGQRVQQDSQFRNGPLAIASFLISLERPDHGIQDILVTERLRQEVDGSGFHCLDRHRDVTVTRHKDDRDANIRLSQFGLKVETADPRQPDIEDQAACNIRYLDLPKFAGRTEQLDAQAYRSEKTAESRAHRYVVVDDEYNRLLGARGFVR